MAKVTYSEVVDTVQDPALSDNYEIIFPRLPEGVGDAKRLRVQIKSAAKPGMEIEAQLVELFGHAAAHAGRKTFSRQMALTLQEDSKTTMTILFENWANAIRSTETQTGMRKAQYAVPCLFNILDVDGSVVRTYKIHGCWPTSVPETQYDQSGNILELSVNLSFDIYTDDDA